MGVCDGRDGMGLEVVDDFGAKKLDIVCCFLG
jgi:hypothetical protein